MTESSDNQDMSARKAAHLDVCIDAERYSVESGNSRLHEVHLIHRSLPECNFATVDTTVSFLGHTVALPFFISSMTGGSAAGYKVNKQLAEIAEALGIPVGMGSIRILLRKPEVIRDFMLKDIAQSVPVFANIGGVQLPTIMHDELYRLIDTLRVDGIAVHLNPGQELFQPEGDRDFTGVLAALERFIAGSPVPVIVKETGMGINPAEIHALRNIGASLVDIAGSGGTNWVRVEAHRLDPRDPIAGAAAEFDLWGLPTGLVLAALGRDVPGVLASGGIRGGMDIVRALALGAEAVGMALPFIRAVSQGGLTAGLELGRQFEYVIRSAMTMSGVQSVQELRRVPLYIERSLVEDATNLAHATGV
jgi:isopentenyl-diphosphate delta-isomerase type 2